MTAAVDANPGEIDVVAIGPLTNLGVALMRDPGFARRVRRFVIMGGLHRTGPDALRAALRRAQHHLRPGGGQRRLPLRGAHGRRHPGRDAAGAGDRRPTSSAIGRGGRPAAPGPGGAACAATCGPTTAPSPTCTTRWRMSYVLRPDLLDAERRARCWWTCAARSPPGRPGCAEGGRPHPGVGGRGRRGFERFLVERLSAPEGLRRSLGGSRRTCLSAAIARA